MNPIVKKKISILIHLAGVDGEFARIEKNFIKELCETNNLTNDEYEQLLQNPEPIGSLGALSYSKAVEYLSDSLSLMIIDGKIRQSEVLLCEDIGLRLGFQKNAIDQIISNLKENITMPTPSIHALVKSMPHASKA